MSALPGSDHLGDARRRDGDLITAKSHRYLRLAMVALLLGLAAAVFLQTLRQGSFLASVSAYYYTPAQSMFVGGLIGLGACMIALKGTTVAEDVFLNLGGVCAAVVAIVPTSRGADYRTAVAACKDAGSATATLNTPSGLDCPSIQTLEEAASANVEVSMASFLVIGLVALVLAALILGARLRMDEGVNSRAISGSMWELGVTSALWLAGVVLLFWAGQWLIDYGHYLAATGLLLCILIVASVNARRHGGRDASIASPIRQTREEVGIIFSRSNDRYTWIARAILVVAALSAALMATDAISLFWLEIAVALVFVVFWVVQTIELEREGSDLVP